MEHTRAIYIIEKSNLDDSDKRFLKTHLEHVEATINILKTEILQQKDIIDYNKALNNKILTLKEALSKLDATEELSSILTKLEKIEGKLKENQ